MSTRKKVFVNTSAQLVGKLINTTSSLIITFLIARFFGPQFYGNFTKVFATTTFFYMILDFGFNATLIKRIARSPKNTTEEFTSLFGLRLTIAALLYLLLSVAMVFTPSSANHGYTPAVKLGIAVFSLQFFTQTTFLSANAIFQNKLQYIRSSLASSLGSLTQLALVAALTLTSASLISLSFSYVVGATVMAVTSLILLKPFVSSLLPQANWIRSKKLIFATAPIGTALILNLFATRLDTILLTLMRPTQEVGFYGLARRVFDVVLVAPTFFMNAAYPIFVKKLSGEKKQFKPVFFKSLKLLTFAAVIAFLTVFLLAPLLVLIRSDFAPAVSALKLLSLSLPAFFITSLLMWTTIAAGKQRLLFKIYLIGFIINISLNLIFIPKFGYLAPAAIAGITEIIILILFIVPVKRLLENYDKS